MLTSPAPHRLDAGRQPTDAELNAVLGDLFSQATVPMVLIGFDHLIKRTNAAFDRLLDRSPEQLIGTHILKVTHPDDRRSSQLTSWNTRRGRQPRKLAKRYLRPDGSSVWARITTTLVRDSCGKPLCVMSLAEDISEEEELRRRVEQLDRLRATLADSSEAMLRASDVDGLWRDACRIAVEHGGLQMAWVGLVGDDDLVVPNVHWGSADGYLDRLRTSASGDSPEGMGPVGLAIRARLPAVFQDILVEPRFEPWLERARTVGIRGVAAFPLLSGQQVRGVLSVYSREPNFFDPETMTLLERLTANVSFAWEALDLRERQARSALEESERLTRFHHVFAHSGIANAITDLDWNLRQVNGALCDLLGAPDREVLGRSLLDFVHPDDRRALRQRRRRLTARAQSGPVKFEQRLISATGEHHWVVASCTLMPARNDEGRHLVWQAQNITAQRRAEELATMRSAQQAAVARLGREALEMRDVAPLVDRAAAILAEQLGAEASSVLRWNQNHDSFLVIAGVGWAPGVVGAALIPGGMRSLAGYALASGTSVILNDSRSECRFDSHLLDKEYGVRSALAAPISAREQPYGVLAAFTSEVHPFSADDLNFAEGIAHVLGAAIARNEAEAELQRQALHDSLTGLPNRALLFDRIALAVRRLRRHQRPMALMFVDIDRFKEVNDTMGHSVGDDVLRTVATRLTNTLRPSDTVARVGGDEFVVLADDLDNPAAALLMADRLVLALEPPIPAGSREVVVTASVGVVSCENPNSTAEDLVRDADIAMYHAKSAGGRQAVSFDADMRAVFGDRVRTEVDLRRALAQEEFVVHYQPCLNLRTGAIIGAEALVRWNHPARGLVPPGEFIPLAEETGAIIEIGAWVLRQAVQCGKRWSDLRPGEQLTLSVNLSTRQLLAQNVDQVVEEALRTTGLDSRRLCLEITETAVLADSLAAVSGISRLRELGVRLALDDFGTGYSSVSHLRRFQLDELKIDKSFIDGVTNDKKDAAIVGGLIQLAHAVGLTASAEGIETSAQLKVLRELGCDAGQGFLMARPLPEEEFEQLWLSGATY